MYRADRSLIKAGRYYQLVSYYISILFAFIIRNNFAPFVGSVVGGLLQYRVSTKNALA